MYRFDYLYSREHQWVRVDGDVAVLGITEFAKKEMGEVVFLELPEVGQVFDRSNKMGTIESVKVVEEFCTPLTGEIVAVNKAVMDDVELLNGDLYGGDLYGEGWLVKIRIARHDELRLLMDAQAYEEYMRSGE